MRQGVVGGGGLREGVAGDGRRVGHWQLELTADVGGPVPLLVSPPDVFIVSSSCEQTDLLEDRLTLSRSNWVCFGFDRLVGGELKLNMPEPRKPTSLLIFSFFFFQSRFTVYFIDSWNLTELGINDFGLLVVTTFSDAGKKKKDEEPGRSLCRCRFAESCDSLMGQAVEMCFPQ